MVQLTLNDKQKIVKMLNKHYTINSAVKTIIDAIADNAEQETELMLKAFSTVGEPKDKPTISDTNIVTVQIDALTSKLQLVKAVKEVTKWNIKECKDFIDTIVIINRVPDTGVYTYKHIPFKIGPDERITVEQWNRIAEHIEDSYFQWHYE